jgi:hypothetical protein
VTFGSIWLSGALAVSRAVTVVDSLWVMRSPVSAGARPLGAALVIVGLYFLGGPVFTSRSMLRCHGGHRRRMHVLDDYDA